MPRSTTSTALRGATARRGDRVCYTTDRGRGRGGGEGGRERGGDAPANHDNDATTRDNGNGKRSGSADGARATDARPRRPGAPSPLVGSLLLLASASLFGAAFHILFRAGDGDGGSGAVDVDVDDDGRGRCSRDDDDGAGGAGGGFPLAIVAPLSSIPLLVFLMVRYVSLRLYLRN